MACTIPEEEKNKCNYIIHSASVAAAGVGLAPVPGADIGFITAIQVGMILGLARVFSISVTKEWAESTAKTALTGQIGKYLAGQLIKLIPGIGSVSNATIAAALTEALGWEIAEDFYKKSLKYKVK